MKNPRSSGVARLALCASMISTLTACGHSAPSESDAKAALESRIADCSYLTLTEFKKTNGLPGDDPNSYQVEVSYTLKFKPSDEEQESMKKWGKLMKQEAAIDNQEQQEIDVVMAKYSTGSDESADGIKQIEAKYKDQQDDLKQQLSQTLDARNFISSIPNKCSNVPRSTLMNFFATAQDGVDLIHDGVEKSYTGTISMIKTDNGWQEAQ